MVDLQAFLRKLYENLNILREREAKYGGNAPLDLLSQIDDHNTAITLTEQAIAGELRQAEWRKALKPLLVEIESRTGEAASSVTIGDIEGGIHDATIAGGDVVGRDKVGGDKVGRDKVIVGTVIINYPPPPLPTVTEVEDTTNTEPIPDCPYRGLFAFRPEHAHFFFGREIFTQTLVQVVESRSLVAVLGASGSGKSSVVLAGLVPALNASDLWLFTIFRPRDDPFLGLASALVPLLYENDLDVIDKIDKTRKLATKLRDEGMLLSDILKQIERSHSDHRLLIIADQFEEIYTLCRDTTIRQQFLDVLLEGVGTVQDLFSVLVLTLRADFLGQASLYRPFADALQGTTELLGPMTRTELTEAIEKPAALQNVHFEENLIKRLLDDVGEEEGSLPLLEFALTELWQHQYQRILTHTAYEEIGQAKGALSRHADQVYKRLNPVEQEQAWRIFVQLVNPGAGTEDTRRLAYRTDLEPDWPLVAKLANERLVVTNKSKEGGETVELVHEALIRHWQQLQVWLEQDREFLTWQLGLRADLKRWVETNHDEGALLRGAPLAIAREILSERPDDLTLPERDFIQVSMTLQEKEAAEKEVQRQRELEQQRALTEEQRQRAEEQTQAAASLRQRTVWIAVAGMVAVVLAILAVIFGVQSSNNAGRANVESTRALINASTAQAASILAIDNEHTAQAERATAQAASTAAIEQQIEAERQANIARSRQLAAQSSSELSKNNYELALALAIESGRITNTLEAFSAIRTAIAHPWHSQRVFYGHTSWVNQASWSQDESRILTASFDGTARIWDAQTGQELVKLEGHTGDLIQASWSQDERRILTSSYDGTARIWDAQTGQELVKLEGHMAGVKQATWNKDESRVLTTGCDREEGYICIEGTARIWDAKTGQELVKLEGHTGRVNQATWNKDESRILTRSDDGTARIWDAKTGQELVKLEGHTAWVWQATWSRDESRVLTAGCDHRGEGYICIEGTARIWDAKTGQELVKLEGHMTWINQATWSRDESRVLTAGCDHRGEGYICIEGTARIWDAKTGQELVKLEGHTSIVNQATWNKDESRILTHGDDGTARIWDAETGQELVKLEGHADRIWQATWRRDESRVLTAGCDREENSFCLEGTARIWDAQTGQELVKLEGHMAGVKQATWNKDESRVLTTGCDREEGYICIEGTARIWDAEAGQELVKLEGHTSIVNQATWNKDESRILTSSLDGTARIWDATSGQELVKLEGHTAWVWQATWSKDESRILTSSLDGTARIWDAETGQELVKLEGHTAWINQATWSQDESRVLTTGCDREEGNTCVEGTARIWDAKTGQELVKLEGHSAWVRHATWSQDENRILTSSGDGTARIWDAGTGQELVKLKGHTAGVNQATWSQDENRILTSSGDGTARIWDAKTGQELVKLEGHTDWVGQATWSQDERRVLTSSLDGTARIWDATSGQELVKFGGPALRVNQATWSQDERRVLTSNLDGTARIWDATSGQELVKLEGHTDKVWQATWSKDESRILTSSLDGTARIWDATSDQELVKLEGHSVGVNQASWSQDERQILTNSFEPLDNSFTLKRLGQSGQERAKLEGHTSGVWQAAWSRDESRILTTSGDGTVRVWYTHMTDLIEQAACPRLPRNMTLKEWNNFMDREYQPTCVKAPIPPDAVQARDEQGSK